MLIFFYTQKFNLPSSSASTANQEIPVIAAPEEPAKATPEPQADTPAPGPAATANVPPPQPLQQGRKQIYDRILGEEAVEQNRLVPTEEQPVAPPRSNDGQDSGETATGGGAPLPEPGSDSGPPAEPGSNDGTAPEPLPLPRRPACRAVTRAAGAIRHRGGGQFLRAAARTFGRWQRSPYRADLGAERQHA